MAIQWYEKSTLARDLVFDRVPFWVQVYDIPFRFANKVVAKGIVPVLEKSAHQISL